MRVSATAASPRRGPRAGSIPLPLLLLALVLAAGVVATMAAYSSSGGSPIRTVALDGQPGGLTIDPASGHAFIPTNRVVASSNTIDPDTHLSMLDLRTGAVARTIDVGFVVQATVVDGRAGRLFIAGENKILLVDTHSGRALAITTLGQQFGGAMVPDERHGRLYAALGGSSGGVAVLNAHSGALLGEVTVGGAPNPDELVNMGAPVVDAPAGRIFVPFTAMAYGTTANGDSAMTDGIALLDATGRLLRTVGIGHGAVQQGQSNPATLVVDSLHRRVVVLDTNTDSVSTLDARSGKLVRTVHLWTRNAAGTSGIGSPWGSWVVGGLDAPAGRLFLTSPQRWVCVRGGNGNCVPTLRPGDLYLFDTRSGRILRRLLPGAGYGNVTVDARAGCALVATSAPGSAATTLDILDARTGALRRRALLAPDSSPLVDARTGHAYIVDGHGAIAALDLRSGRLSAALALGNVALGPQGVGGIVSAVSDGRAIVLHDNVNARITSSPDPLAWLPSWLRQRLPWSPPQLRAPLGSVSTADAPR